MDLKVFMCVLGVFFLAVTVFVVVMKVQRDIADPYKSQTKIMEDIEASGR